MASKFPKIPGSSTKASGSSRRVPYVRPINITMPRITQRTPKQLTYKPTKIK